MIALVFWEKIEVFLWHCHTDVFMMMFTSRGFTLSWMIWIITSKETQFFDRIRLYMHIEWTLLTHCEMDQGHSSLTSVHLYIHRVNFAHSLWDGSRTQFFDPYTFVHLSSELCSLTMRWIKDTVLWHLYKSQFGSSRSTYSRLLLQQWPLQNIRNQGKPILNKGGKALSRSQLKSSLWCQFTNSGARDCGKMATRKLCRKRAFELKYGKFSQSRHGSSARNIFLRYLSKLSESWHFTICKIQRENCRDTRPIRSQNIPSSQCKQLMNMYEICPNMSNASKTEYGISRWPLSV